MKRIISCRSNILIMWILVIVNSLPAKSQGEAGTGFEQYLFPSFSKSLIKTKAGKEVNIILNYNMVSEKLVFEQKEQYYDLTNPEQVDTAYIQNMKFVPHEKEFVEVIYQGKYPFYLQHKADLQAPPRPGAYGTTSELTSSNYLSGYQTGVGYYNFKLPSGFTVKKSPFYWIRIGEEWFRVNSEKQVPKIFPENESQIKDFIKKNRTKAERPDDMIKLAGFCNGLSK